MPYICLARNDIPDGILQVTDLWPNTSQRNNSIDPPAQTRYINRAQSESQFINSSTGKAGLDAFGLKSYLIARVEPWGGAHATGTVTVASSAAADTVTIAGVVFTCGAGVPNPALQQFQSTAGAGSDNASAQTLVDTVNNAASQALITAALGSGRTIAASRVNAVVTLTISSYGSLDLNVATLASSTGVRLAVSGAYLALAGTIQTAANYKAAADAIIARVDAGSSVTLSAINAILAANLGTGTALTSANGSRSCGSVEDVLSILAGRGFFLAKGDVVYDVSVPAVPEYQGSASLGSFTYTVSTPSGVQTLEHKPIRSTVDGTFYQGSLSAGQLAKFQSTIILFPNSDMLPFFPDTYHKVGSHFDQVTASRVVTVYNDDGTVA